jgi:hypothetical protein
MRANSFPRNLFLLDMLLSLMHLKKHFDAGDIVSSAEKDKQQQKLLGKAKGGFFISL